MSESVAISLIVVAERNPGAKDIIFRLFLTSDEFRVVANLQRGNPRPLEIIHKLNFTKGESDLANDTVTYIEVILDHHRFGIEWYLMTRSTVDLVFEQIESLHRARVPLSRWKIDTLRAAEPQKPTGPRPIGSKVQVDESGELYVGGIRISKRLDPKIRQALLQYQKSVHPSHDILSPACDSM